MIKFYNAGAGSGKTHTLSEELADFIVEQNGSPSQVILTTFTIKAAEELKERVRKALLQKGETAKAAEMSNALIGTVNSICSRLVEKYALEEGLSPELRVLDEISAKIFFDEFVNNSVDDVVFIELNKLSQRFSAYEKVEGQFNAIDKLRTSWPGMVKALASRFRAYNFDKENSDNSKIETIELIKQFLLTDAKKSIAHIWKKISETKDFNFEGKSTQKDEAALTALENLRRKIKIQDQVCWDDFMKTSGSLGKQGAQNNPWLLEITELCAEFHQSPEFASEYCRFIELIYDTAFELIHGYQVYKQERGLIDFSDQELLFLKMLKSNPFIKKEISETFRLVMVDEFQDSSPVQIALFNTLKDLVPKNVWVGDPKQAIYGFRDSDSELFNITLNAVKENPDNEIKFLPNSHRSRQGIVNAVNSIFKGIFHDLIPEEHIILSPSAKINSLASGYETPAIQIPFYNDKNLEEYYGSLAIYVKNILQSELQVFDKRLDTFRNIRGGDIALLFRGNAPAQTMASILIAQGIEVSCEAVGLQQQAEILWIKCLIRLFINQNDPLAIANLALLENSTSNVEQLLAERLQYIEEEKAESWIERSSVATLLSAQIKLLEQMPLLQAINHLITASSLPRYCVQWGKQEQRMSNISKVIELVAEYQQQCGIMGLAATFTGFLNYLSDANTLPPSESENAVTLMTVHKAKGLEWPMVIVAKLSSSDQDSRVIFNTIHVQHPAQLNPDNILNGQKIIYMPWPFSLTKNVPESLATSALVLDEKLNATNNFGKEEDRLLYVALTRARDYLVLPHNKKESGCLIEKERFGTPGLFTEDHWSNIKAEAKEVQQIINIEGHEMLIQSFPCYSDQTVAEIINQQELTFYIPGKPEEIKLHAKRFISPSMAETTLDNVSIKQLNFQQSILPLTGLTDKLYARIGTSIHNAFASWKSELPLEQRINVLQQLIKRMQLELHINSAELDERFLGFWEFIKSNYNPLNHVKELSISQVTDKNGLVTSGIADLVLELEDGLILIDHKTFPGHFESMVLDPSNDHYAGNYATQLRMYQELLEKSTGKKVIAKLLHYVVQGRLVEVTVGED
jgi:ATP-dependent exoDNAse (exonuclease V) beta subunit